MIRTERLLSELFENPKNIVLITDAQYNIRYASASVESVFGMSAVSVRGRNGFDFIPDSKREEWYACLTKANGNASSEINLFTNNGDELHFDVTVSNHSDHDEIEGMVVVMHDITERKRAHHQLKSKNEHLDHFIHKTTHDLRAPLRSALGLVGLAELEPADYSKYLGLIKTSLLRLEGLIDEVSSLYKNEKLAIINERIDVTKVVHQEIDNLKNLPEMAGIMVDVFVDSEVPFYTDPLRFRAIVANILSNSIKYSDAAKVRKYIQVSAHVFKDQIFMTIEDNGVGIEPEYHEKVFDIFFRANDTARGTGLGLYIVKDTISRLGGNIYLRSKPGEGTAFTITLPNAARPTGLN